MKIITWNVNGLRAVERKELLRPFLAEHQPDILLIQETKSQPEQVAFLDEIYPEFEKFYHSAEKPGYSGVGVWVSSDFKLKILNLKFVPGMPDDPVANEGRIGRIDFETKGQSWSVLGTYFPNGGKSEQAWSDKLVFYQAWLQYVNKLRTDRRQVVWAGDINCAHHEIDLARPKDNDGKIGFHPAERTLITQWIENKWADVWRTLNPRVTNVYSWWHLITRSRAKNVGWRIDYFFIDQALMPQAKDIKYLMDVQGSDHCPVVLEIKL